MTNYLYAHNFYKNSSLKMFLTLTVNEVGLIFSYKQLKGDDFTAKKGALILASILRLSVFLWSTNLWP